MAKKKVVKKQQVDEVVKKDVSWRSALGKTSGLRIHATWCKVFEENTKKQLSDEEILAYMKKEFPGRELKSKAFNSVTLHRRCYNQGRLGQPKPKTESIAYNTPPKSK